MTLRAIPKDMSSDAVGQVDAILTGVRREHGVHIPWAIESGSRAWGFPSPDSDYDGRFIYVRPASQSLTLWPRRDVIETPLIGDMDVNGWELSKAIRLMLKGNAVVIEWLQSPIIYHGEPWFRDVLLDFARGWMDRSRVSHHYLGLGRNQAARRLEGWEEIPLKKIFYVLRPAAALRWLRLHPGLAVPPMHFPTLMRESEPPPDVVTLVAELIARKVETKEMGQGVIPPELMVFIQEEFERADTGPSAEAAPREAREAADELFVDITRRLDRDSGA